MTEETDQTTHDQHDSEDESPVVDGRESANEVAEELKENEDQMEETDG